MPRSPNTFPTKYTPVQTIGQADALFKKLIADLGRIHRLMLADIQGEKERAVSDVLDALAVDIRLAKVLTVLADSYLCEFVGEDLTTAIPPVFTPIYTLEELRTKILANPAGAFKLMADIDATADTQTEAGAYWNDGAGWDPIGTVPDEENGDPTGKGFQGVFDGNGHTITGLKIDRPTEDYVGLFAFTSPTATVKNLTLARCHVSGKSLVGGLVGGNYGLVYNCHVNDDSYVKGSCATSDLSGNVGGIVGDNDGTIRFCSFEGEVHGLRDVGGIAGDNDYLIAYCWADAQVYGSRIADIGIITGDNKGFKDDQHLADTDPVKSTCVGCFAYGKVWSEDTDPDFVAPAGGAGGISGDNRGGKINLCFSAADVEAKQPSVAGICPNNELGVNSYGETKDSIISNCAAVGNVIIPLGNLAAGNAGGLVGKSQAGYVFNSFCANEVVITAGVNDRADKGDFCADLSGASGQGVVRGCYYDSTIALIGSSDGGTPKTTAELYARATYENWDFNNIWSIKEGEGYPTLPDITIAESAADKATFHVYPVAHVGVADLTGAVVPKVMPGNVILAVNCDDTYYTPLVIEDRANLADMPLSESRRFPLVYNPASDNDLDEEYGLFVSGTVAEASKHNEKSFFGFKLDPAIPNAVVWSGLVPNDYADGTTITVKARWRLTADGDAVATAWRMMGWWNKVDSDGTVDAATAITAANVAVGAAEDQDTMHELTLFSTDTLDAGDMVTVTLLRDAAHANDTFTKEIFVFAQIWAEYTADKL